MKIKYGVLFALAVCALCFSAPAFAHHGTAAYDTSRTVTEKGTVTEFDFINPHVLIYMNVRGANGKITKWSGELTSPNHLARAGWTRETLKPGETVTIAGFPAKNGDPIMSIRKLYSSNGEEINTAEN
jgi:hypothetical protein